MTSDFNRPLRIFLAEDNRADVYLIRQILNDTGLPYELEVASGGTQALAFFEGSSARADRPALIILDLNLPQYSGSEILERIRTNPAFSLVPVVILTSSDSPADKLAVGQLGVARYIRKPTLLDEYRAIGQVIKEIILTQSEALSI